MSDRIIQDGQVVAVNDQPQQLERMRGLGLTGDLVAAEAASWRRFLPGTLPWTELHRFEREVERLEARRRKLQAEAEELNARLRDAPSEDAQALANWERSGRRGPQPESSRPQIEAGIERLQQALRALHLAVDDTTAERAEFIAKNRGRLQTEAREVVEKEHSRAVAALDEFEAARAALVEARRLELWAHFYPRPEAGQDPRWQLLGGGLSRALEKLGITNFIALEQIITALREDVEWLPDALSTDQAAALADKQEAAPAELTDDRGLAVESRDPERDRAINADLRLRAQLTSDRRRGAIERLKRA